MKNACKKPICGYPNLWLMAVMLIATTSCSVPLRETDVVPTMHAVPHSSIMEYKPLDISGIQIVHVQAVLPGRSSDENAAFRNYVLSHIKKIGPWKVTDNVKETAAACGMRAVEETSPFGMANCQFLTIQLNVTFAPSFDFFRVGVTKYPGKNRALHAQGTMSFPPGFWGVGRDLAPLFNLLKKWHDDSLSLNNHAYSPQEYSVSNEFRDFTLNARTIGVVVIESQFHKGRFLRNWGHNYVSAEISPETSLEASQRLGENVVKKLTEYGYAASVLSPDAELKAFLERYCSLRGDIAVQALLIDNPPLVEAVPIMKKHELDALMLVGGKETITTNNIWKTPLADHQYFDFALLDKSGRIILYERYGGCVGCALKDSISWACERYVLHVMTMTEMN